jgi:hypothetical protein
MELTNLHKFCFCPRGNGWDTHRFAEAIYLGSIPITEPTIGAKEWSKTTPILIVDSLLNVTEQMLEEKYKEFQAKEWSYDHFRYTYWRQRIMRCL